MKLGALIRDNQLDESITSIVFLILSYVDYMDYYQRKRQILLKASSVNLALRKLSFPLAIIKRI
jgi:hypothetical protein